MKAIFKYIVRYFIRGLIFLVPTAATIYVLIEIFVIIDGIIPYEIPGRIPGLGILTLIVLVFIFGLLTSTILAQPFMQWGTRLLDNAPLVKTIYSAIKDLVTAFVGQQKKFDHPVLVKMYENAEVQKLGFLTSDDLHDLGLGKDKVAVYLPHSYAFSGNLFVVPAANVTPIDAKPANVMKFIVSGGVTSMKEMRQE